MHLADDLIGYLIPAWGFSSEPGTFTTTCFNDADNKDPRGHQHKLEDESVGPTAGNLVAEHLTALLDKRPDPTAHIVRGRFVHADGSLSRRAAGAVGVRLAGGRVLTNGHGARFMDYGGAPQSGPDIRTRGMIGDDGARWYLDVYPDWSEG